jgi:hypothetical protein
MAMLVVCAVCAAGVVWSIPFVLEHMQGGWVLAHVGRTRADAEIVNMRRWTWEACKRIDGQKHKDAPQRSATRYGVFHRA